MRVSTNDSRQPGNGRTPADRLASLTCIANDRKRNLEKMRESALHFEKRGREASTRCEKILAQRTASEQRYNLLHAQIREKIVITYGMTLGITKLTSLLGLAVCTSVQQLPTSHLTLQGIGATPLGIMNEISRCTTYYAQVQHEISTMISETGILAAEIDQLSRDYVLYDKAYVEIQKELAKLNECLALMDTIQVPRVTPAYNAIVQQDKDLSSEEFMEPAAKRPKVR